MNTHFEMRLTDHGNAERMIKRHSTNIRKVPQIGALTWDGARWTPDRPQDLHEMAIDTALSIYDEAKVAGTDSREVGKWAAASLSRPKIDAMVNMVLRDPAITAHADDFDQDPMLLNVANGTIDLRTRQLRAHDRTDHITKITHVNYDEPATCPRFERFLLEIMAGSEGLVSYMKRVIGYSLTGLTSEHALFFLHGLGANGKSVLLDSLNVLFGDYGATAAFGTFTQRAGDQGPRNDIARLRGKRHVAASEGRASSQLDEATIKQLTGGDNIAARKLYQEYFEFVPQFKLMIATNHVPQIKGRDYAIWRRIHLIPFSVRFEGPDADQELSMKLRNELPGILNWATEGCIEWQKSGLCPPSEVLRATDQYKADEDILSDFVSQKCVAADRRYFTPNTILYKSYKEYCQEIGEQPIGRSQFGTALGEQGFPSGRKSGIRGRQGIQPRDLTPVTP